MSATTGPNLIRNSITRLWYLNIFSQKPFNTNVLAVELLKIVYIIETFLTLQRYHRSWIRNLVLRKIISKVALRTAEPSAFRLINYRLYAVDGNLRFFGNYAWRSSMLPMLPPALNKGSERINIRIVEKRLKKLMETRYINKPFLFKHTIFKIATTPRFSKFLSQKYTEEVFNILTTLEQYTEPVEGEEIDEEAEANRGFYKQLLNQLEYKEQRNLLEKFNRFGESIFQITNKTSKRTTLRYYKYKAIYLPKERRNRILKQRIKTNINSALSIIMPKFINKKSDKKKARVAHAVSTSWKQIRSKTFALRNYRLKLLQNASKSRFLKLKKDGKNVIQRYKNSLQFRKRGPRNAIPHFLVFWYTQIFNKLFSLKINNFLSNLGYYQLNDINLQNQFVIPEALNSTSALRDKLYTYRFNIPKNNSFKNLLNLIPAVLNFQAMHLLARQTAVELSKTKQHKRIIFLLQTILTVSYMQFRAQPLNAKAGLSGLTIKIVGRPQKSERTKTMVFNFGQTPLSSFKKNTATKTTAVANAQIGAFSITITTVG